MQRQLQTPRPRRNPVPLAGAFLAGLATGVLTKGSKPARTLAAPAQPVPPRVDRPAAVEKPATDDEPRPDPDAPGKPESPTELTRPSLRYVLRQTIGEFTRDQCMDLAAALTYYAVLSLFPALLVVMSLLGVFGQGERTADTILGIVDDVSPGAAVDVLRQPLEQLVNAPSAGFTLVAGILGALWSASGYVGAFGRAMNRIYEVEEGRPAWKLRLQQLGLTFAGLIVVAVAAFLLAVSGPVAETLGARLGIGETGLAVWNIARWPVLLVLVVVGVATLYYTGPNVKQPKFRWISVGAAIAIVTWIVASLLFGLYVANFGSYNKTFGTLAGVIVFLLWLWLTNLALLFGAEVDAELERGRQLQAGIAAEDDLQLPLRDTTVIDRNTAAEENVRRRGRRLRRSRGQRA
ncbi:MAG: YihY/virulence factor BrkB family protein [Mycobacterium kyogaense]|uniref:YihY/virulence factor BrkB family protein n=1 Tax=Mycobacterium kyogaense TaxID=2212479 RepID=UPI002FF5970C